MITAFGRRYETERDAHLRLRELRGLNEQFGASDDRVTEINAIEVAVKAARFEREHPYVLLYRKARPDGSVFKGRRRFRTMAEQTRFIREAPDSVAITFYTT